MNTFINKLSIPTLPNNQNLCNWTCEFIDYGSPAYETRKLLNDWVHYLKDTKYKNKATIKEKQGAKKMDKTDIATRMKGYEEASKFFLTKRVPVAVRIDGKAFHTFTRGFQKPFDPVLRKAMNETMLYLCQNIQGCVLGYCQSDEISLILIDYKRLVSQSWLDYKVQKIASISASMATMAFNKIFTEIAETPAHKHVAGTAMFDSRCFNIPKEEVTNLILWRQQDATRNSIRSLAQAHFSHKQLEGVSCNAMQNKLFMEKGINWNECPTIFKRGACCSKRTGCWEIDTEIPVFKNEGREYIECLLEPEEE